VSNGLPILVTDFDGVICDSTEECVVTAWNAWLARRGDQSFVAWPDQVPEPYRSGLRGLRNYVRTAGEYLVVIEAERDSKPILGEAEYDRRVQDRLEEVQRFAPLVFAARQQLRREDEGHWLNLHTIYPGVPEALRRLWPDVDGFVVTGKDAETVRAFFERFGLPIPANRVYDRDAGHDKTAALRKIVALRGRPLARAVLVDDNVRHVLPVLEAGGRAILAGWGYHTDEQLALAHASGLPIATLDNWPALALAQTDAAAEENQADDVRQIPE
jgi:phosphoglycolate phosphatase-like HAD superfamily hydrolase